MNESMYTITLSRLEICDLMMACTSIKWDAVHEMENDPECPEYRRTVVLPGTVQKWTRLHDKLERQLDGNDANSVFCELSARYRSGEMTAEEFKAEVAQRMMYLL